MQLGLTCDYLTNNAARVIMFILHKRVTYLTNNAARVDMFILYE